MSDGLKLGVLISGRGSNLQALIDACASSDYPAEIALVISNVPDVQGLERAKTAGIPTATVNHKDYSDRQAFEDVLHQHLSEAGVTLVCLAGFMRVLSPQFVERWPDRIINVHPSLLPAFKGLYGMGVHNAVIESGARISGCTVHFVCAEVDDGPIIVQSAVPVLPSDTADTLSTRVLEVEHQSYPLAVRLLAEGAYTLDGRRVIFENSSSDATPLISPVRVA